MASQTKPPNRAATADTTPVISPPVRATVSPDTLYSLANGSSR